MPGERRDDGIDTMIQPGGKQRERSSVRDAGEADHRIIAVLGNLGAAGGEVDQLAGVRSLVRGIVQVDKSAGRAKAAGGVDDHCVAGQRERTRGGLAVGLGAAEPMCQHDGRPRRGWVSRQDRRVELYRFAVLLRRARHLHSGLDDVPLRVRRYGNDYRQQRDDQP